MRPLVLMAKPAAGVERVLSYATFGRAISHAIALSRALSHRARDTVRDSHCHCNKNMFYVVLNDPRVESSRVVSRRRRRRHRHRRRT